MEPKTKESTVRHAALFTWTAPPRTRASVFFFSFHKVRARRHFNRLLRRIKHVTTILSYALGACVFSIHRFLCFSAAVSVPFIPMRRARCSCSTHNMNVTWILWFRSINLEQPNNFACNNKHISHAQRLARAPSKYTRRSRDARAKYARNALPCDVI